MTLYKVGNIVNTHGIRGELKVMATTDFPEERFVKGQELVIDGQKPLTVIIQTVRQHKQFFLISFKDMQNINDVEKYKGRELMIDGEDLQELDDNEFYYHEIVGLTVIDNENGETLGTVKEIMELPANDVWVVSRKGHDDIYLPYIESVVTEINLDDKTAHVTQLEEI